MKKLLLLLLIVSSFPLFSQEASVKLSYLPSSNAVDSSSAPFQYNFYDSLLSINLSISVPVSIFFISGEVDTFFYPLKADPSFYPFYTAYTISAGLKLDSFSFGVKHLCSHSVFPSGYMLYPIMKFDTAYTEIYIKYTAYFL